MSAFIPHDLILSGNQVRLEPLMLAHENALRDAACDGELWNLVFTSVPEPENVAAYIQTALDNRVAFAVIDERDNRLVGCTSFYRISEQIPRVSIGFTWYRQSMQRTHINTTCKLLMLQYAFETLNCAAVGWETDIINHRSQAAIERLGAKKDGVIRAETTRRDGSVRDTVFYSMLHSEWADAKAKLQQRLEL